MIKKESGIISLYQRGETYIQQRKFRENGTPTDVTNVEMHIFYPCSTGSAEADISHVDTGVYQGNWCIPSDATYGEYIVEITATSATEVTKFVDSFIILPWNITQHIRSTSGIKECNDIDNDDIAFIAWNAYLEARDDIFKTHFHEPVKQGTGHMFGCDDIYYIRPHIVTEHLACGELAVTGHYIDTCKQMHQVTVNVLDAFNGEVEILDEYGETLPCNTCNVYLTYKTSSPNYTEHLFKKAIIYLAAHEIVIRFNEIDKATLADLQSNRQVILAHPDRMIKNYKRIVSKIADPKFGGV
jgi:hypothetical protein